MGSSGRDPLRRLFACWTEQTESGTSPERIRNFMISTIRHKLEPKRSLRVALLVLLDVLVVNLAAFLALYIRFEFSMTALHETEFIDNLLRWALPNTAITLCIFALARLYGSLWAFAGVDELERIVLVTICSMILQVVALLCGLHLPRSFPVLYGLFLGAMTTAVRFSYRFARSVKNNTRTTA